MAAGLVAASLYAILSEERRLIRYGSLIGPYELALWRLAVSRWVTLATSAAAVWALMRVGRGRWKRGAGRLLPQVTWRVDEPLFGLP